MTLLESLMAGVKTDQLDRLEMENLIKADLMSLGLDPSATVESVHSVDLPTLIGEDGYIITSKTSSPETDAVIEQDCIRLAAELKEELDTLFDLIEKNSGFTERLLEVKDSNQEIAEALALRDPWAKRVAFGRLIRKARTALQLLKLGNVNER